MGTKDPRVDLYIRNAAEFARPILTHLRRLVHQGCPEVNETIKWSVPHFERKGILCNMAAFKAHCAFGFWRRELKIESSKGTPAMGDFGRLTSLSDLPKDQLLLRYIREAAKLNEAGIKRIRPRKARGTREKLLIPPSLAAALKGNTQAAENFEQLSYSHQKEYAQWIAEAKMEKTRERRVAQALDWLAAGKPRHWKHQKGG